MSSSLQTFLRYLKNQYRACMTTVWRSFQTADSHYLMEGDSKSNTFDTNLHSHYKDSSEETYSIILSLCLLLELFLSHIIFLSCYWLGSMAFTSATLTGFYWLFYLNSSFHSEFYFSLSKINFSGRYLFIEIIFPLILSRSVNAICCINPTLAFKI